MAGSVFLRAIETAIGESNTTVPIEIVRVGSFAGEVTIQYGVIGDSATSGADFNAANGTIVMPDGASSVIVQIPILDDLLSESTEVLSVTLISASGAELSAPRTHRISILDDETPAPPPPLEPPLVSTYDVTLTSIFDGFAAPVRFTPVPGNPSMLLVAEKAGLLRSLDLDTGVVETVLDLRDQVNNAVDRGLMDVVIHPDFASNPYVYLAYVVDPPESASRTGLAGRDGGGNRYAQVVRYTMDVSGAAPVIDPASAVILVGAAGQGLSDISGGGTQNFADPTLADRVASDRIFDAGDRVIGGFKQDYLKVDSQSHAGLRMLFGPDGMLYVTTGDGIAFNTADPRAVDVQSLDGLSGKVLRIDPITGRGLADNPFASEAADLDANRARIWQSGLRNAFSAVFDEEGRLFLADVGWTTYEELNTGGPGANFGWPYFEGGDGGVLVETPGYRNLPGAVDFYDAVAAGDIAITPAFRAFGHAAEIPGYAIQAIIMGALVPDSGAYPDALEGHLLFSDFLGGRLFSVDTDNRTDTQYLFDWPGELGPIHMEAGPDGVITYLDITTGEVGRLGIAAAPVGGSARVSITPVLATRPEGTGGSTAFTFTVTRTGAMGQAFSLGWSVAPAFEIGTTPAQEADFAGGVLPSGTVSFAANQAVATVTVAVAADDADEAHERFDVRLGAPPAGVSLALANAGAVIFNDDDGLSALAITADKGSAPEGTGGTTTYSFTVSRVGGLDHAVSAKWRAAGELGPGTVGTIAADFAGGVNPTGVVSFAPNQTKATITVAVAADALGEFNERFGVTLSNPSEGATISNAAANAVILNDDISFEILPGQQSAAEGNAGSTAFTFTIRRAGGAGQDSVAWSVSGVGDQAATASDFVGGALPSGIASFGPGDTSRTVTIAVAGDTQLEADEGFAVTLSSPSGLSTIITGTALATIVGDETAIGIAPLDARKPEGTGGPTPYAFTVTRQGGLSQQQTVAWSVAGIAGPGTKPASADDFVGATLPAGLLTFAPGEAAKTITIQVAGDDRREFNERFAVALSAPTGGATLATSKAGAIIENDDTAIGFTTPRVDVAEGNGIWTTMSFYVERTGASVGEASVDWTLVPGGVAGTLPVNLADFYDGPLSMGGTITFNEYTNTQDIVIAVKGDAIPEFNESFRLVLSNPTGATLGRAAATGVVLDDDVILGTTGNDTLTGTAIADLFLIGTGQDVITGGDGRDRFQFLPSALGPQAQNSFTFTDFAPAAGERLDLSRIDAIAGTGANDAFAFIGTAAFTGTPGQLRWADLGTSRLIQGDVNGDSTADLTIFVNAAAPVDANWFAL